MTATLTFPNLQIAEKFEIEWTRFTMEGRDRSAQKADGSYDIKVYNVDSDRQAWIENWIKSL
jgi:hypothetical protein